MQVNFHTSKSFCDRQTLKNNFQMLSQKCQLLFSDISFIFLFLKSVVIFQTQVSKRVVPLSCMKKVEIDVKVCIYITETNIYYLIIPKYSDNR